MTSLLKPGEAPTSGLRQSGKQKLYKNLGRKDGTRAISPQQRKLILLIKEHILDNAGLPEKSKQKLSWKALLKRAGYAESIQLNPHLVLNNPGFQELLEMIGFSDIELVAVHKDLLHNPDPRIRLEALKEGYRIKDKYPTTKIKIGRLDEIEEILTSTDIKQLEQDAKNAENSVIIDKEIG